MYYLILDILVLDSIPPFGWMITNEIVEFDGCIYRIMKVLAYVLLACSILVKPRQLLYICTFYSYFL